MRRLALVSFIAIVAIVGIVGLRGSSDALGVADRPGAAGPSLGFDVAKIIIEKQTIPDGAPGTFSFSGSAVRAEADQIGDGGQISILLPAPGTYTAIEAEGGAFALTSITCDDGGSATASSGNVSTRTATFNLDVGETVICTFTNSLGLAGLAGDVDCDGDVDSIDAALLIQFLAALFDSLNCPGGGDVNYSGSTNAIDAAIILQFIAGLVPGLPVGTAPAATPTPTPTPTFIATPTAQATGTPPATATGAPPATVTGTPPATVTGTPPATVTPTSNAPGELTVRKVTLNGMVVIDSSASGWEIRLFEGSSCGISALLAATTPLSVNLSPGTYSVSEVQQAGWERVLPVAPCVTINLVAGGDANVEFQNRMIP